MKTSTRFLAPPLRAELGHRRAFCRTSSNLGIDVHPFFRNAHTRSFNPQPTSPLLTFQPSSRSLKVPRASSSPHDNNEPCPTPFNALDYHTTHLSYVYQGGNTLLGFFLFRRNDTHLEQAQGQERLIMMSVGGDTLMAVSSLFHQHDHLPPRPLSINLLWSILERGQALSEKDWSVLHVAVTGTLRDAYVARIYFGNKETGEILWDVDARPSDATWIALQADVPIYISTQVWDENSVLVSDQEEYFRQKEHGKNMQQGIVDEYDDDDDNDAEAVDGSWASGPAPLSRNSYNNNNNNNNHAEIFDTLSAKVVQQKAAKLDPLSAMKTVWSIDPEPLKRLKMELNVALNEQDFQQAARIRDHPFMTLHVAAIDARKRGDLVAAAEFEDTLMEEIMKMGEEEATLSMLKQHGGGGGGESSQSSESGGGGGGGGGGEWK